jgi:uncharacterized hydrophobic protein (TIGR00271 family)
MNQENRIDWWRYRLATKLGINESRKEALYLELARAIHLRDINYWLQVIFAAAIATLGLVLNSPAVIIGAMLISPLMGGILATGLALATADVVLALRAFINLILSSLVGIAIAALLVGILPFKETTTEILARTRPNVLDLVIALCSGIIGTIATARGLQGGLTSLPGVSIAVALMPPLCTVGYGIGSFLSSHRIDSLKIASGGALLFITNLVAIALAAMGVFAAVRIDVPSVKKRIEAWYRQDPESLPFVRFVERLTPKKDYLSKVGSPLGRLLILLIPFLLLLIPLDRSLQQLRQEVDYKQTINRAVEVGTRIWQEDFANLPNKLPRSALDRIAVEKKDNKFLFRLNVLTNQTYQIEEQKKYVALVASALNLPSNDVALQLTEISTDTDRKLSELTQRLQVLEQQTIAPPASNVPESQMVLSDAVKFALEGLSLPAPAQLLQHQITISPTAPIEIKLLYLSSRDIDRDGAQIIVNEIRNRLQIADARIVLERLPKVVGQLNFGFNRVRSRDNQEELLDRVATILKTYPQLNLELTTNTSGIEDAPTISQRLTNIRTYLGDRGKINPDRFQKTTNKPPTRNVTPQIELELYRRP